jgi:hypothetical protein
MKPFLLLLALILTDPAVMNQKKTGPAAQGVNRDCGTGEKVLDESVLDYWYCCFVIGIER